MPHSNEQTLPFILFYLNKVRKMMLESKLIEQLTAIFAGLIPVDFNDYENRIL